ncbi:MAG: DMT family transporter [Parachlamydiales bacterium]|jgi:drug/metabolite transporter (DMT)-like permease
MENNGEIFLSRGWASIAGAIALALWAAESTIVMYLGEIPPLQLIAIVGGIGFLATLARVAFTNRWHTLRQPPKIWLVGIVSFTLVQACYASAFQYAPPAGVDMIYYLWPIEVIILSNIVIGERFTRSHIFASMIAMVGMTLLFMDIIGSDSIAWEYNHIIGYVLAFIASLAWTAYTLFTRRYSNLSSSMMGGYMGVSALVTAIGHFLFEKTVVPTSEQWMLMVFYGISLVGIAYLLWDYGLKRGHYQTLNVLSYMVPMGALTFLVLTGLTEPTTYLLCACACITLAALCTLAAEGSKAYKKRKTVKQKKMQERQESSSILEPIAMESA